MALALSIPSESGMEVILTVTYIVVVFSILAQGLTVKRLITSTSSKKSGDLLCTEKSRKEGDL